MTPIDIHAPDFGDLYDELPLWSAPFGLWILDRAPMRAGQTVLDLGAGTGFLSIELAERCGGSTMVWAVDPWHAAAQRLRRKIAQRGLQDRIRVLEQDAAAIDLPAASVDLIVSNLGINNFERPADVMRACARVARPGARLLLTTQLAGHMAEFYEVYRQVLVATGQADRLAVLQAHVDQRATVASLRALLGHDGRFEVDEVACGAFRMRFASGAALLRHHFIRLGFVPAWQDIATPGRVAETFAALQAALDALAAREGELALTVPTAFVAARRVAGDGDAQGAAAESTGGGAA